jgi:hypothetical protein
MGRARISPAGIERSPNTQRLAETEEVMRNLAAVLMFVVATALVVPTAMVVATAVPAAAQHVPHGAREFFAPEPKAPPRVTPFAPHPADIFYENSAMQVFRDQQPEE